MVPSRDGPVGGKVGVISNKMCVIWDQLYVTWDKMNFTSNDMQLIPNDTHLTTNDTHLNRKNPHDQSHPSLCGPEIVNIFSHTLVCITMLLLILPRPIQNVSSHKETLKRAYLIRFFDNYGVAFFSTLTFFWSVK